MPGILELGHPRGEAMKELSDLVERRTELERKLDQVDRDQWAASEEVEWAANALVGLEQRSAGGEDVSGADRKRAEDALAKARSRAASPWAERKAGIQEALRRHDDTVARFIGTNLDELLAELDADAAHLAEAVNAAATELVAAFNRREEHAGRVAALAALVGRVQPGDVQRTRSEEVVRACSKLLQGGGEPPPVLLHRPGQPRHGAALKADEEAEMYAPGPAV